MGRVGGIDDRLVGGRITAVHFCTHTGKKQTSAKEMRNAPQKRRSGQEAHQRMPGYGKLFR
jgi:hypothetical protein